MGKLFTSLLAITLLLAPQAEAGTIENAVGNTVAMTTADGMRVELRLLADGTFSRSAAGAPVVTGVWRHDGDMFCGAVSGEAETCTRVAPNKSAGDTWIDTDASGATMTLAIIAGQ